MVPEYHYKEKDYGMFVVIVYQASCTSSFTATEAFPALVSYCLLLMFSKIRLCALNDDSSEESDHEPTQESVKQAKVGN